MSEPLLLSRRLEPAPAAAPPEALKDEPRRATATASPAMPPPATPESDPREEAAPLLVLCLSASERQRLRGHCRSACGRELLLQLPRGGGALQPQERLAGDDGVPQVRVEAAPEELLRVRSEDPFTLLRAAYHLGNRHVALELRPRELRLLQDPVLADLLRGLGLSLEAITAPFEPESGAYAASHGHSHAPGNSHAPGHSHGPSPEPDGDSSGVTPHHSHGAGSRPADSGHHHRPHRP